VHEAVPKSAALALKSVISPFACASDYGANAVPGQLSARVEDITGPAERGLPLREGTEASKRQKREQIAQGICALPHQKSACHILRLWR
jgi:hypothetical protein